MYKETYSESAKTVKILRDTRCMQNLILTSTLPTRDIATGEDVLISGVVGSNRVPLHTFYLKSDLITVFWNWVLLTSYHLVVCLFC